MSSPPAESSIPTPRLSRIAFAVGVEVAAVLTVSSDREKLHWALRQGREARGCDHRHRRTWANGGRSDAIMWMAWVPTGDEQVAGSLKRRFEARGIVWTPNNLKQAPFPEGSVIVPNPIGTAPGFRVPIGPVETLIWLSGVPQEMTAMLNDTVIPWIVQQGATQNRSPPLHSKSMA